MKQTRRQYRESKGISMPHHNDVLCGRGSSSRDHPGNGQFRSFVNTLKEECVASLKSEKQRFAKVIVLKVRSLDPPGRFLKLGNNGKGQDTTMWYDIGNKEAIRKTSQALREEAKQIREGLKVNGKVLDHDSLESLSIMPQSRETFNGRFASHHVYTNSEQRKPTILEQEIIQDSNMAKQDTSILEKKLMSRLKQMNDQFDRQHQLIRRLSATSLSIPDTHSSNKIVGSPSENYDSVVFACQVNKPVVENNFWDVCVGTDHMSQTLLKQEVGSMPLPISVVKIDANSLSSNDNFPSGFGSDECHHVHSSSAEPTFFDDFSRQGSFTREDALDLFSVIESL